MQGIFLLEMLDVTALEDLYCRIEPRQRVSGVVNGKRTMIFIRLAAKAGSDAAAKKAKQNNWRISAPRTISCCKPDITPEIVAYLKLCARRFPL